MSDKIQSPDLVVEKIARACPRCKLDSILDDGYCVAQCREITMEPIKHDMVNQPPHYTSHPSGVECITIAEHFNFCLGNAMKYIWRAGLKQNQIEDLKKARWYLDREIQCLEKTK